MYKYTVLLIIITCLLSPIFLYSQDFKWADKYNKSSQILLSEGFNEPLFPPLGWQSVIIAGWSNWERKTSNIYPTCTPYESTGMTSFPSYSAPDGSMARLISPPLYLGASPLLCTLKFAMYHDNDYSDNPDSIKVEYSFDGINFNRITAFRRYQPVTGWTDHTVYLGTLSDTLYMGLLAFSDYGNNMNIDYVRLIGSQIVNDVGIDTIISPSNIHINNTPIIPIGRIKNYGIAAQTNFPVTCSIFGSTGILIYTSTVITPYLASDDTLRVSFPSYVASDTQITVIIRTNLTNDQNPTNDRETRITSILPAIIVISPNGGEYWAGGTYQSIRWQSPQIYARYLLLLSRDSGITYIDTIADNLLPNDTMYNWIIPILNISTCRISLKLLDSTGTVLAEDASDADFVIDSQNPQSPTLISPIDGIWLTNDTIIFIWSPVTFDTKIIDRISPVRYIVQVDTSENFTNPIMDTTSSVYDTLVITQARYVWRVRAYDLAGNQGLFSIYDSFGIDYTPPSIPDLINPAHNAFLNDSIVRFYWHRSIDNISGVRDYRIQIANNSSYNNPIDTILTDTTFLRKLIDTTYFWRVRATDLANNQTDWSTTRTFTISTTSIEEEQLIPLPFMTVLYVPRPNPVHNRITHISYSLSKSSQVSLKIYNTSGNLVKTLIEQPQNSGTHIIRWNCKDNNDQVLTQGIYVVQLQTQEQKFTKKLILTK
jgi:hypothetical protein